MTDHPRPPEGYPTNIRMPETMWFVREVTGGIMYFSADEQDAERYAVECREDGYEVEVTSKVSESTD